MKISPCGDFHLEENRYFEDTAQCLEWFVEDSVRADTNLFVVGGDLTTSPELRPDLSDLSVEFRVSPTRRMDEVHALYEDGELRLPEHLDLLTLKDSRVKLVVTVSNHPQPEIDLSFSVNGARYRSLLKIDHKFRQMESYLFNGE